MREPGAQARPNGSLRVLQQGGHSQSVPQLFAQLPREPVVLARAVQGPQAVRAGQRADMIYFLDYILFFKWPSNNF